MQNNSPVFASYAPQCEDAVLWSLLGKISRGFFLTVEIGHPQQGSVTHGLYEHGWRGINITADPNGYEMATTLRPDDRNIYAHVAESDTVSLQDGVAVLSLEAVCRYYVPAVFELLHLGETADKAAVIRSLQWQLHRPRVVLVQLGDADSLEWEALLTQQHYRFMQRFGCQRVYLAEEQLDLSAEWLANPARWYEPCVWYKEARLQAFAADLAQCRRDVATMAQQHEILKVEHARVLNELQDVYSSKAWRITLPLRLASHYGKGLWRQLRNRLAA